MLLRKKPYIYIVYMIPSFIIFHIIVVFWGKFYELVKSPFPVIIYWPPVDSNIQCYDVPDDALQSVDDPGFLPKSKSIFFHETSCRGGIDSRQACAVESAARTHPDWEVYLLFTAPVTNVMVKKSCLMILLQFPNVRLARINVESYSRRTIVKKIFSQKLQNSLQPVEHAADILKILTLRKWGGVTIDLDVFVTRSLDSLSDNWIAKESPFRLASAVMRFSKDQVGRNFTRAVLREISTTYNTMRKSFNGAMAIERVLMRKCRNALQNTGNCQGISILGNEYFYPIRFSNAHLMVQEGQNPLEHIKQKPYTYCMWNEQIRFHKVHPDSAYVKMAKKVCPLIYKTFGNQFGV